MSIPPAVAKVLGGTVDDKGRETRKCTVPAVRRKPRRKSSVEVTGAERLAEDALDASWSEKLKPARWRSA